MGGKKFIGGIVFGFVLLGFCYTDAADRNGHVKNRLAHEMAVHLPQTPATVRPLPARPAVKSRAPAESVQQLPDLRTQRIWLQRGNFVAFELKNAGPGKVPPKLRASVRARLSWRGGHRDFGLKTVDPHAKLTKPGGSVRFATKIRLQLSQHVTVALVHGTRRRQPGKTPAVAVHGPGEKT